jgi:LDH2 family malate/lactate/ureidoglycolate dehydrogenase
MSPFIRVRPETLEAAVRAALAEDGVADAIARIEAEVMVEADRCGVPSHGVLMLPRLLAGLRDGRANRAPALRLVREQGATCVLDGDHGPGRFVAVHAMDHAVARARTYGVGVCLAINTTHWGRAHAYACRAARAGLIGICTTNAIPTMMAPGLPRALLGNNPVAIAAPRGGGQDPVVLDLALTQAAFGKVATHAREGRPIPGDWGVDGRGAPTTDAAAILASGLLLPMGGHKGFGLALMMELLTAALAGGPLGHEIAAGDATGLDPGATKLLVALDPAAFGDAEGFTRRVGALLEHLRTSDPEHPQPAPGDRGWHARDEYDRDGIPIHPAVVAQLESVGVRVTDADGGGD